MITAGINYATNPSWEGTNDWSATNASMSLSTENPYVGDQSLLIAPTSATNDAVIYLAAGDRVPIEEDDEVNISIRALTDQSDGYIKIRAFFYVDNATGTALSSHDSGWVPMTQDIYEEFTQIDMVAPATATYMSIEFRFNTGASQNAVSTSDRFKIDALTIRRNEQLDTYIDGDQGSGYAWVGPAHASISTRASGAGEVYRAEYEAPQVIVSWQIWRANASGQKIEEITDHVSSGFIESKADRAIVTQGQLELTDALLLDPLSDYVALEMTVEVPPDVSSATYKMGLYEVSLPSLTGFWNGPEGVFNIRDMSVIIGEASLTDSITFDEGDNIVDEAEALAIANGANAVFPPVSKTLAVDMTHAVGENILAAVNKMLEAAGCYPAWMNLESNNLVTIPIRDLNMAASWKTLTPDMLLDVPDIHVNNPVIPNVVLVIKANGDEAPLVGEARNDDAGSPTSTVARAREIAHVERNSTVATQTEADNLAAAILQEKSSFETSIDIVVIPDRPPSIHDSLTLAYHNGDFCLCGKYWIRSFRYDILGSSAMKIEINRTKEIAH